MATQKNKLSNLVTRTIVPAIAASVLISGAALGSTTREWTGQSDNNWLNPFNWSPSGLPGSNNDLKVLTGNPLADNQVNVDNGGGISVDGAQTTLTVNDPLTTGHSGQGALVISGGGKVSNTVGYVGFGVTGDGTATVTGTDSSWANSADLTVGHAGTGSLTITDGGRVSNYSGNIGNSSGSEGSVIVDGHGSTWANSWILLVGNSGTGSLTITDGGRVSSNVWSYIGNSSGSEGSVIVDGHGSTWANSWEIYVGRAGTGSLTITRGGHVSSSSTAYVSRYSSSSGSVLVDGVGSTWMHQGNMEVGARTGSLVIRNDGLVDVSQTLKLRGGATVDLEGGTLRAGQIDHREGGQFNFTGGVLQTGSLLGDLVNEGGTLSPGLSTGVTVIQGDYTQTADGRLLIELAGTVGGSEFDSLAVAGLMSLAGTVEVNLLEGFMPEEGDSFQVLFFDQISGAFDHLLLPTLAPGLAWDTSVINTAGTLSVIPEPASLSILALGGLALLRRRAS